MSSMQRQLDKAAEDAQQRKSQAHSRPSDHPSEQERLQNSQAELQVARAEAAAASADADKGGQATAAEPNCHCCVFRFRFSPSLRLVDCSFRADPRGGS